MSRAVPQPQQARHRRGLRGEWMALAWLRLKAYRLLAWRYCSSAGEIDLIVRRGGVLAFVEVKTHSRGVDREYAGTVADGEREQRMLGAAGRFLARHPHLAGMDMRFDLVTVRPWHAPHHLTGALRKGGLRHGA